MIMLKGLEEKEKEKKKGKTTLFIYFVKENK